MDYPLLLADTNVSFPGLGINNLPIDRIAFQLGSFPIYWYGICIILAFGACVGLAMKQAKNFGLTSDHVIDFCLVIIPASVIGARLYYVIFSWKSFSSDLKLIFDIRSGGLAVLGGVILCFAAVLVTIRIKKLKTANVLDFLIVYLPLGQAIGRWGNFFNQEAFGTNTNLPWGMISEATSSYIKVYTPTLNPDVPVHPTFLYESLATILIFIVLLIVRKRSKLPFSTVATYFILYGVARFFIEGLRTDSLYIGNTGLRSSQVLSAVLVVAGFGIIAVCRYLGLRRESFAAAEASPTTDTTDTSSANDTADTNSTNVTADSNYTAAASEETKETDDMQAGEAEDSSGEAEGSSDSDDQDSSAGGGEESNS